MVMHPLVGSPSSVIGEQSTNDPQSNLPSLNQRLRFEEKQGRQRQMAKKATEHCHKQMIRHASKKNPPSVYHISKTVLVIVKDGAHLASKKYWGLPGKIMKRNLKLSKYKIQF